MVILVVDDDIAISEVITSTLTEAGHTVHQASTAQEALDMATRIPIAFAIVDLLLPDRQGWDVVRVLRRRSSLPIIVISAIGDLDRRVQLLQSGADDYLVKPFEPRELLARLEAVQRRLVPIPLDGHPEFTFGPYRVNIRDRTCLRGFESVRLTQSEFVLLETLITTPGRVYSRDQLLDRLHDWDGDDTPTTRSIDVHIATLRAKIETDPRHPQWIETVWGVGYRFRRPLP